MKALIIENEMAAAELLSTILNDYCSSIDLKATAKTIKEAFNRIEEHNPDVLFLDIELDDGLSFELLDLIQERNFHIIFTTAYDQYALNAFRYDAVDYILKPYTPKSVIEAVSRLSKRENVKHSFQKLNELIEERTKPTNRIALHTAKGIRLCADDEIIRLEASSSYCTVFFQDGEKVMISRPLGDIEKSLPEDHFHRVHTSHTININQVKQVVHDDGGYIIMIDGTQVPLARRRKQEFINLLKSN